ncbi:MAG TPA: hypothetical protein PKM73_04920 [Verrucomicrobiota bacterium]|nr:hypothetical protein [Verrucomicrobiota bacterium]HNU50704.1 hypothetical protein [Verrucomicrobiota bacterium]
MNPDASPIRAVYPAVTQPHPEAIVVYCSDPRFQIAFEQFVARELDLERGQYFPLVVGGGAGVLAHPEQFPKEFKFMRERLELYRSWFPSIRRIVLINHEDCRYYGVLKRKLGGLLGGRLRLGSEQAHDDLRLVASVFGRLLHHLGVEIELYYARFADETQQAIVFEPWVRGSIRG